MMNTHAALKSNAHTGTPSLSFVILRYFDSNIASSLANDQVKRELACTLPIAAMKATTVIEAMKVVAATPDLVA